MDMNQNRTRKKLENETDKQFIFRICKMKDELGCTWKDIAEILNKELGKNYDESCYRKQFQSFNGMFEANMDKFIDSDDEYLKKIQAEKDELYKIKKQVQDQRREYNKLLTSDARSEHLNNKMLEATEHLFEQNPLEFNNYTPCVTSTNEAVLVLSDWHFGMVTDNIWNTYNQAICKGRVVELFGKTVKCLQTHNVNKLHIVVLGDLIHGHISTGVRLSSDEKICDEIMQVSEMLATLINSLSQYVNKVEVYMTYGNHGRSFPHKEESIHSDNLETIIPWYLKQRLQANERIIICDEDCYEFIWLQVCGYNIIASHGDLDNVKSSPLQLNALFNKVYDKSIDYVLLGDKHHVECFEQLGIEATIVGSLCGTDEYANTKRLYSVPSQSLMIFNELDGKLCTYNIRLYK